MTPEVSEEIEIRITIHRWNETKWDYDYYGDRSPNPNYGAGGYYKHAKFTLPSGKKKCLRFGDTPDDEIKLKIAKSHQNLKFNLQQSKT